MAGRESMEHSSSEDGGPRALSNGTNYQTLFPQGNGSDMPHKTDGPDDTSTTYESVLHSDVSFLDRESFTKS